MKKVILSLNMIIIVSLSLFQSAQSQNTTYGNAAGIAITTGVENSFFGIRAGLLTRTGSDNSCFGRDAMCGDTTINNSLFGAGAYTEGNECSLFGAGAGRSGNGVCAFGYKSGESNQANYSSFFGYKSGYSNTKGVGNSFFGNLSGYSNTEGVFNSFFGDRAGYSNTIGSSNSFYGISSGNRNTTGSKNVFFGLNSGASNTIASENTFLGYGSGIKNTEGPSNTYIGYCAGGTNVIGESNVFIGQYAGYSNKGSNNVSIGAKAYIEGDNSIVLGTKSKTTASNSVIIGYDVETTLDNTCVIGGLDTTNNLRVGIGTLTPNEYATLDLGNSDKGFMVSRMSETERATFEGSLGTNEEGMMVYDKTDDGLFVWDGTAWIEYVNTTDLTSLLDEVNTRIAVLEGLLNVTSSGKNIEEKVPVLYQNAPNPFTNNTVIGFYVPDDSFDVKLLIYDINGQLVQQVDINERGKVAVEITKEFLFSGTYFYTLNVDNQKLDSKIMVLVE